MIKLYILLHFETDVSRLLRWAKFYNISVKIIQSIEELNTLEGFGIFISNNLYPEPELFFNLISGKHYLYSDMSFKGPKLLKSFCVVTNDLLELKNVLIGIPSDRMVYSSGIAFETPKEANNARAGNNMPESERCDLLQKMLIEYSNIFKQQRVAEHYYTHLWINACQNMLIDKGTLVTDITKVIRDLSVFTSSIRRTHLGEIDIQETLKHVKSGIDLYECMTNNIQGYTVKTKISRHLYTRHILTAPGKVVIEPDFLEEEFDPSITVISFYYNLGYAQKPSKDYYESLEKFCQIGHPLVFYGDFETCEAVRNFRKNYIDFTKVIEMPIGEWELVEKYSKEFRDMDLSRGFKRSKKYSILTCSKFWAIEHAINLNPFVTQKFAWFDCGIFRHKHIAPDEIIGKSLFSNTKFDKVSLPCSTLAPGTTDEEFDAALENVMGGAIWGINEDWRKFLEKFKEFVTLKFDQSKFLTEQVMLSRFVYLHPELYTPVLFGYNYSKLKSLLNIK